MKNQYTLYHPDRSYTSWCSYARDSNSLDKVYFVEDVKRMIIEDPINFLSDLEYYRKHGMPFRRRYCFWGGPGQAKP